jgi:iron uptake system component EfeO
VPQPFVRQLIVAAAALAVAGGLSACGSDTSNTTPGGAASPSTAAGDPHTLNVTITAAGGCAADRTSLDAGAVTVKVANKDATGVSEIELISGERIVGEKENLPPGFSGDFTVQVEAGTYSLYCPGATTEKTPITVTGTATSSADTSTDALLATGAKQWGEYVQTQVGYLVTGAQALTTALKGTDLTAAQTAYKKARVYYEKIEPVAESFASGKQDLDADIDAREGDVPVAQWRGFHRIEKGLFADKKLAGLAKYGDELVTNTKKLQTLTTGLTYKPFELANGAQELLDEVSASKVTGEEERYSHIDLLDFQGNVEGAQQAFADLQPGLAKIDSALASNVSAQFAALNKLVDKYRTAADPSGFKLYSELTASDKKALANAVKAVQEPLSKVASKVTH